MEDRAHPICYALTVARAIREMSNDAIHDGQMPPVMTSVMVRTAAEATLSLSLFAAARQHALPPRAASAIESAKTDLETLMQLAELVRYCGEAPQNATHVARAIRDIAELAANHLKQASDSLS